VSPAVCAPTTLKRSMRRRWAGSASCSCRPGWWGTRFSQGGWFRFSAITGLPPQPSTLPSMRFTPPTGISPARFGRSLTSWWSASAQRPTGKRRQASPLGSAAPDTLRLHQERFLVQPRACCRNRFQATPGRRRVSGKNTSSLMPFRTARPSWSVNSPQLPTLASQRRHADASTWKTRSRTSSRLTRPGQLSETALVNPGRHSVASGRTNRSGGRTRNPPVIQKPRVLK